MPKERRCKTLGFWPSSAGCSTISPWPALWGLSSSWEHWAIVASESTRFIKLWMIVRSRAIINYVYVCVMCFLCVMSCDSREWLEWWVWQRVPWSSYSWSPPATVRHTTPTPVCTHSRLHVHYMYTCIIIHDVCTCTCMFSLPTCSYLAVKHRITCNIIIQL